MNSIETNDIRDVLQPHDQNTISINPVRVYIKPDYDKTNILDVTEAGGGETADAGEGTNS